MNDGSLTTSARLVAELVPTGSSSKTSAAYSLLTPGTLFPESCQRWPKTGFMHAGHVYELPTSAPPTSVSAGSALHLKTPQASDGKSGSGRLHRYQATGPDRRFDLVDQMAHLAERLLPTPRAQNGETRNQNCWVRPLDQPQNLENAIGRLLPTPDASAHKYRLQGNS